MKWAYVLGLVLIAGTAQAQKGGWVYHTIHDAMRDKSTWVAQLRSSNGPRLSFPYQGGSPVTLTIAKQDEYSLASFNLSRGQFSCSGAGESGDSCHVAVKIDDKPVITMNGSADKCGAEECMYLTTDGNEPRILELLPDAKDIIVELPLYDFGSFQYHFHTAGLKPAP